MVEIVKEEDDDIDITFEDEVYEAEYITDAVTDWWINKHMKFRNWAKQVNRVINILYQWTRWMLRYFCVLQLLGDLEHSLGIITIVFYAVQ